MKTKKMLCAVVMVMMLAIMFTVPAFAAGTGDVAGAIEGTWTDASAQIKTVVNNVVFPVIDLVLAVFFFAKLGMAYFDYRKHGQFEWTAPAILFACLNELHLREAQRYMRYGRVVNQVSQQYESGLPFSL